MNNSLTSAPARNRLARFSIIIFSATFAAAAFVSAKPVPGNLANGLNKVVENRLIEIGVITGVSQAYRDAVAREATKISGVAIRQAITGKYLVDIMPNGRVPVNTLRTSLQNSFPLLSITALDANYAGHGVIEGYVVIDDVPNIAKTAGVGSITLQLKPIHRVGAVTEHGVHQHRVNRINTLYNPAAATNYDGTGMQIGVLSDSFDSQPSEEGGFTTAAQDVATGDLPGSGNPVNSQPVIVLEDYINPPFATNEGRGMCQIVHDMAPRARIGFASANLGEVEFANNIRALGGLPGYTKDPSIQQGFAADVICDDVLYIDEPMFQDGLVAQGAIDVVNAGKTYCSSAGNDWGTDGYASVFRPVTGSAATAAIQAAGLDMTGVDPALYAGGFHNFKTSGVDIAQTINTGDDAGFFILQWNDPYDTAAPQLIQPPMFQGDGNSTAGAEISFTPPPFAAGHMYVITEFATPQNQTENFDAIVRVTDPSGNVLIDQDTGVDEVVTLFAPVSGQYTITVHPFATQEPVYTQGHFHVDVNEGASVSGITQDFNCLFFDMSGHFISALDSNSFVNNRPYELSRPSFSADGFTQVQMVISRSNRTAAANAANQLKCAWLGNGLAGVGPAEYGDYLTPITFGHNSVAGANGVAAYDVFRPNIPEDFTSPGPVTIYFDVNNNRLPTPEMRQKPDIAAADGSNNTFFPIGPAPGLVDSQFDLDDYPNFYGTSAASPHAAALAALILQSHGGPGSLTPLEVKTIMQTTAFPHDLDPFVTSGSATAPNGARVSITVRSDNSRNTNTGSNDANAFTVQFTGSGRLTSLSFNPEAMPETGGNPTGGNNRSNPTGNLPQDFLNPANYSYTPGMVWTSTYLFGTSVGLGAGDVVHTRTNPAPAPSNLPPDGPTAHMWTLNFTFPNNNFTNGKLFRFNNGRLQQQDATVPTGLTRPVFTGRQDYSADMLGSGVLLPEWGDSSVVKPGMTFTATIVDRNHTYTVSGRLANNIGKGYSPLDGYGFINAEAAVAALPDLIVSSLTASKNPAKQGERVTLSATIKNQGTAIARASATEFLLDGSTVLGSLATPTLAPGATATVSVIWNTAGASKAPHAIRATADRNNAVSETMETNNTGTITVTIR